MVLMSSLNGCYSIGLISDRLHYILMSIGFEGGNPEKKYYESNHMGTKIVGTSHVLTSASGPE